jgi:tetratricopeptide (TPR) repeat protein
LDLTHRADELLSEARRRIGSDPAQLGRAITLLEQAIHLAPRDPRPSLLLSDALRRLPPNHDEGNEARSAAIAFGVRGVWLAPADADAHLTLARAYHRQHWFRLSIEHLRTSWDLEARAETAFWMGWMLSEVGELDEDLAWLARARELQPDLPGLAAELGYAYRVLERYPEAETALRDATREDPEDSYAQSNLILLLVAQDRDREAIDHATSLMDAHDPPPALVGVAALAHWLTGDRAAAAPLLEHVIDKDRSDVVGTWGTHAVDLLAEIHWRAGRTAEARELLAWSAERYGMRWRRASEGWGFRFDLCRAAAMRGEREAALRWLQDASDFGWNDTTLARRDPMLETLQADASFQDMLRQTGQRTARMHRRSKGES